MFGNMYEIPNQVLCSQLIKLSNIELQRPHVQCTAEGMNVQKQTPKKLFQVSDIQVSDILVSDIQSSDIQVSDIQVSDMQVLLLKSTTHT